MPNTMKKIGEYSVYFLWSNALYGLVVYSVFRWLASYSLLYAYLGNLALIVLGLAMDEYMQRMLQSEKLVAELKKEKDSEKNFRFIHWIMDSFISFKTSLYLFYVLILIVSQIIKFDHALVGENMRVFISANDYSILLLIALDTLIRQFSNDRGRMRSISENLKKALDEADN